MSNWLFWAVVNWQAQVKNSKVSDLESHPLRARAFPLNSPPQKLSLPDTFMPAFFSTKGNEPLAEYEDSLKRPLPLVLRYSSPFFAKVI
jgi:hypothetical protein